MNELVPVCSDASAGPEESGGPTGSGRAGSSDRRAGGDRVRKSVLPPLTPIPGLEIESVDDLLTDEDRAEYAAWIADVQRKRRRALEWAATHQMP